MVPLVTTKLASWIFWIVCDTECEFNITIFRFVTPVNKADGVRSLYVYGVKSLYPRYMVSGLRGYKPIIWSLDYEHVIPSIHNSTRLFSTPNHENDIADDNCMSFFHNQNIPIRKKTCWHFSGGLTCWVRDKMATILLTTFSISFFNEIRGISHRISLKLTPEGPIGSLLSLV